MILKGLFPEFSCFRVNNFGKVIMKRKWYSLHRIVVHATDLCLTEIPCRLSQRIHGNKHYSSQYSEGVQTCFMMRNFSSNFIDYLFDEFCRVRKIDNKWALRPDQLLAVDFGNDMPSLSQIFMKALPISLNPGNKTKIVTKTLRLPQFFYRLRMQKKYNVSWILNPLTQLGRIFYMPSYRIAS